MPIGTPTSLGSSNGASGTSSITITTTAAITAGNLVVLFVNFGEFAHVASVSDGTNTYVKAKSQFYDGSALEAEVWYCTNASAVASGASLTATLNTAIGGSVPGWNACAIQVSGISATSPLDVAISNTTSSASPSLATGTLNQSSEIIFGLSACNDQSTELTYTESAGFTNLFKLASPGDGYALGVGYDIVSSSSSVTYNPSWSGSPLNGTATFVVSFATAPVVKQTPVFSLGSVNYDGIAPPTSVTLAATANIQAGDTVVVAVGSDTVGSGGQSVSVSDGANTYTRIAHTANSTAHLDLFYCANCVAVTSPVFTVTCTTFSGTSYVDIAACRIPGLLPAPLDVTNAAASTSLTTGVLGYANEVVIGAYYAEASSVSPNNGFTDLVQSYGGNFTIELAYLVVSSTASVTYSITNGGSVPEAAVATFKIAPVFPYGGRRIVYVRR